MGQDKKHNSKLFDFFENIAISDQNNFIRKKAIIFLIYSYPERSRNLIKYMLKNDPIFNFEIKENVLEKVKESERLTYEEIKENGWVKFEKKRLLIIDKMEGLNAYCCALRNEFNLCLLILEYLNRASREDFQFSLANAYNLYIISNPYYGEMGLDAIKMPNNIKPHINHY
jgi:hypothetical protein